MTSKLTYRFLLLLGTFVCLVASAGAQNTPPYFIQQPFDMVNQTVAADPTTWQTVMQPVPWWPNELLFAETSTRTVVIPCNAGGTGPFTCTWYTYGNSTLSTSSTYTAMTPNANGYTMSSYNGGTNCQLSALVLETLLDTAFFCSVTSSATNIPALSDIIAFAANPTTTLSLQWMPTVTTYQYIYIKNVAAVGAQYPLMNSWFLKKTIGCQGTICTATLDSTRFITDDQGTLHMISLQAGDFDPTYNVVCESRVGMGNLVAVAFSTVYTPGVIGTGTQSTSATATLKYVSGAGQVSTATATGSITALEGQQAVTLACVFANKATAVSVYWAVNGTALGNVTSGALVIQQVGLYSGGTYTCYEVATPSAVSTINLVIIPRLRLLQPKTKAYLVYGMSNGYLDASYAVGPTTITYIWSVNGQKITSSSSQAGWALTSNTRVTHAAAPQASDQTVLQLQMFSGAQMRQYAFAVLVVNPMTLGASPFATSPFSVSLSGTTTVTSSGTGDSRVNNGQLYFAWIFKQIPLSQLSTTTQANFSSNDTNYWPAGYVVLWNNGVRTASVLPALSFTTGSGSASMTWTTPLGNASVVESYRGIYCVKAYNDAEARFLCAVVVFAGDAVAGAVVVAAAGFPWWAILLLVIVPLLILCCCFLIIFFCCWWCRRRRREGIYHVEKREVHEGNDPVRELRESGFRPQEPGVVHPLDPKTAPDDEAEEEEEETHNTKVAADEVPLTARVATTVTHSARPPPPPSMNGQARPPVYGDRMYMAVGAMQQASSRTSNVDGVEPPRAGYSAAQAQASATSYSVTYGNPPGGNVALSPPSPRATLTYAQPPNAAATSYTVTYGNPPPGANVAVSLASAAKTTQQDEAEEEEAPNMSTDEVTYTTRVAAPVTHSARPPPPPPMNGYSVQPPLPPASSYTVTYGNPPGGNVEVNLPATSTRVTRTYVASTNVEGLEPPRPGNYGYNAAPPLPPAASYTVTYGNPPPGGNVEVNLPSTTTRVTRTYVASTNVEGLEPPRPGNYVYNASSPLPPAASYTVTYGNPPGSNVEVSQQSTHTSLTYAPPPAPGQPLPAVQFYSSNQAPSLVPPPRRTTNRDSLI